MKLDKLKTFANKIAQRYHAIEHYFTQGEFGIKFYPFLMHPCVRKTRTFSIKLFSVLIIFGSLYYLFGELITILFSEPHFSAYTKHSTIELLIAKDLSGSITPLFYTMQSAFAIQSWLFILGYIVCITYITGHKFRLLGILLSLLFSVGTSIITASQGGNYTAFGYLYNLGFGLTFLIGNLAILAIAFGINRQQLKGLRNYSILTAIIGISCIAINIFMQTPYAPWLERIGIYSVMIWEIVLGFKVLHTINYSK